MIFLPAIFRRKKQVVDTVAPEPKAHVQEIKIGGPQALLCPTCTNTIAGAVELRNVYFGPDPHADAVMASGECPKCMTKYKGSIDNLYMAASKKALMQAMRNDLQSALKPAGRVLEHKPIDRITG